MPRLTAETWADIRAEREAGASFRDLAARFGVDHAAIARRAKREDWLDGTDAGEAVRRRVNAKVHGIVTADDPEKRSAALDAAADRVVEVIDRHREEWQDHRQRFGSFAPDFEGGKHAKISAEMLLIRQKGERLAWGIEEREDTGKTVVIERSFGAGS